MDQKENAGQQIKVLVVEDKLITAEHLRMVLENYNYQVIGPFSTGEDALIAFEKQGADLALLDIELEGTIDGIDTAAKLRAKSDLPIVFLTDHANKELQSRALLVNPANYLSKPFDESNLVFCLAIAVYNHTHKLLPVPQKPAVKDVPEVPGIINDCIFVRGRDRSHYKIRIEDILWIESEGAYIHIMTEDKKHVLTTTNLGAMETRLENHDFARVHRSFIVNLKRVESFSPSGITILGANKVKEMKEVMRALGGKIPIASAYRPSFENRFRVI